LILTIAGKEQVEQWLNGEQIEVIYRNSTQIQPGAQISAEKTLNFGQYTINTPNDLRDYILNDENWYEDLIEDKENREDFIKWMLNLYDGDQRKRSAFNRIIKYYSQEGADFVADAIIRFFIPAHPVIFGLKSFDFAGTDDIKKTTAEAFSHLISDLWDNSSDKDIQLYLFRYEFALWQQKDKRAGVLELLNILYKYLYTTGKIKAGFYNYKVYAYTTVSKNSLKYIKQFLCEYLPAKSKIDFIKLGEQKELHYRIEKTLMDYFIEIGINNPEIKDNYKETITVKYAKDYNSINDFYKKTIDDSIDKICKKHQIIRKMILETNLELFKSNFVNAYNRLSEKLKYEYDKLKKEFPGKIKRQKPVKSNLKEIESIITGKIYHKINSAFYLISETRRYENKQLSLHKLKVRQDKYARKKSIRKFVDEYWGVGIYILPIFIFVFIMFGPELLSYIKSKIYYYEIVDKNLALQQIEMVSVKGGTFKMGHEDGPDYETPVHTVSLDDFYIGKYEITNEQFSHFLNDYGSINVKDGQHKGAKMIYYSDKEERDWGINQTESGWQPSGGYKNYPVVYVTWYGANEYCKWAGGRLPTEAEWEYAARGGVKTDYAMSQHYKYAGSNNIDDVAWYDNNSDTKTHKVGTKNPNELGIYDLSGNVFEWCQDWYNEDYYSKSPKNNPVNLTKSKYKVLRGGSYYSSSGNNMPCYRIGYEPTSYYSNFGFRLCKDSEMNPEEEVLSKLK